MTVPSVAPPARSILAYDRRTGAPVALVPSNSKPGSYHLVTATCCDCVGFIYRRTCRHLNPATRPLADGSAAHLAVQRAAGSWLALSAETRAKAAEYTAIFGRDGDE